MIAVCITSASAQGAFRVVTYVHQLQAPVNRTGGSPNVFYSFGGPTESVFSVAAQSSKTVLASFPASHYILAPLVSAANGRFLVGCGLYAHSTRSTYSPSVWPLGVSSFTRRKPSFQGSPRIYRWDPARYRWHAHVAANVLFGEVRPPWKRHNHPSVPLWRNSAADGDLWKRWQLQRRLRGVESRQANRPGW